MQRNSDHSRVDQACVTAGWVDGARRVPSPNCNARPEGVTPDLLVVHNIALPPGEYGGPHIEALFTNRLDPQLHPYFAEILPLEVSAHFLIRRDGELLQFVPTHLRAWHAGQSIYRDRDNCNDFSIGIELEGSDDIPFTEAQYQSLAELIMTLRYQYPGIAADAIVGHCDIAPGRKTDPGPAFNWRELQRRLSAAVSLPRSG